MLLHQRCSSPRTFIAMTSILPARTAARTAVCATAQSVTAPVKAPVAQTVAPLFTPFKLGPRFQLEHRMVLPPLTRTRSTENNVPVSDLMSEYYAQRATKGGLLIAEGTLVSANASGYPRVPGIWRKDQVEAWKPVVQAVKAKGAVFFNQIWHCGRVAIPDLSFGNKNVAPSANVPSGPNWVVPTPLDKAGIKEVVQQFATAALNAIEAGFDGVEIHGANGYLIDQFNKSSTNQRTDEYGGCIENRARFVLEVVDAVVKAVGADRVGLRLSPFTKFLDATDDTPYATFTYIVEQLNKYDLAYLHMVEPRMQGSDTAEGVPGSLEPFRKIWHGPFIAAGGYEAESGAEAVRTGHADLVAYGRWWISNPDLPTRFQRGAPLTKYDRNSFYLPGPKGYTDYPFLESDEVNSHK